VLEADHSKTIIGHNLQGIPVRQKKAGFCGGGVDETNWELTWGMKELQSQLLKGAVYGGLVT